MNSIEKYSYDERTRKTLEQLTIPFAVYQYIDKRVATLVLSDGFCRLYGYEDRAQAYLDMDRDMYRECHPDDVTRIENAAWLFATEGGRYETIYRTRTKNGSDWRIIHAYGEHVYTDDGVRLAYVWYSDEGIYREDCGQPGTELTKALSNALHENSIVKASQYDALTGLPSMSWFFELAEAGKERIRQEGGNPVLLYMDFRGMKFFNSKHGFAEGDKLLQAFAKILAGTFGNEHSCRISADHFAVQTEEEGLDRKLQQLLCDCRDMNGGKTLPLHVGVYIAQAENVHVSVACDRAKLACQALSGRYEMAVNTYSHNLSEDAEKQQYIIENLDRAIAEKWIQVYLQPIIRGINEQVCDVEALARWIDPVKGVLSPASFIPALEDAGLIYKLDLYMVDQVLETMKKLRSSGLDIIPHSINLSRVDFDACDIVEEIRRRVDEAGVSRDRITIEITESVIGSDFEFMKGQVERFRSLGFPVWMDDFGSGYSSLDVLQSIRFDLIKFDMSFMRKLNEGEAGKVILTELMKMATSLGLDTVCEGVETEEQVHFLREIGCSKLQGYYFSKPVPPEQILSKYTREIRDGIEDGRQSGYYDTMGRVNLYDLSFLANQDDSVIRNTFDTVPMGIMELNSEGDKVRYVRTNQSFRDFMKRAFKVDLVDPDAEFSIVKDGHGSDIMKAIEQCRSNENRAFIDEELEDGSILHSFLRRIVRNPVNGRESFAMAVLSITQPDDSTTYADIARALAADYYTIYVIDLDTDDFIEYTSQVGGEELSIKRRGADFFEAARRDTMTQIYQEDREPFLAIFSKEQVVRDVDTQGVFTTTYRLIDTGTPMYVNMKITRMKNGNRLIMGISMIDAQMKQQEEEKRLRQEKKSLGRIAALSPDYLVLYTVDPITGSYTQYNAAKAYEDFGLAKRGEDFFADVQTDSPKAIAPEDLERHLRVLTKDNMLSEIRKNGFLIHNYRMLSDGKPMPVSIRATLIRESDGEKIILGITNDEEEYKRKLEKAYKTASRNAALYTHVAHALARDCAELYYVNIETDEFIEFHTDDKSGVLSEARRGTDFFEGCERDAKLFVHREDQAAFVEAMNRDFLKKALDENKVFVLTYRRLLDGRTFYVQMKVSRMEDDPRILVIAVSDIDELMRKRRLEAQMQEERLIYARLHAITGNFIVIYVVDPETGSYREFSASDDYEKGFAQAKDGADFFDKVREVARDFNHPDDLERFLTEFTREKVMAEIERSGIFTLDYRLIMEGVPVYVQMKAALVEEKDGPRLVVGLNNVDAEARRRERGRELARQNEIYDQITASLAEQYEILYYIDVDTGTYHEISATDTYKKLNVPATGSDFFAESRRSIRKYVHPEDQEKALSIHYKDVMLKNLENRSSFSLNWRLVVNGQVRHIRHTEIMSGDRKHILVCIKNIDAEVQAELALKADQEKTVTYTQIAERLAAHYDLIYYIDCANSNYAEFSTRKKSGELKVQEEGDDFFAASRTNADRLIYAEDRERIKLFLDRDNLISQLESRRQLTEDYRLVVGGGKTQYTRMSVTYSSDRSHFIICVENRDEDVRREKEHLAALNMANELARRDELTHTKNKTAYHEAEKELQREIDAGDASFGIVVCDINGLKVINDTEGHRAGDDYIKTACKLICGIFHHSPVFRIGGDEFVVILRDQDYEDRSELLADVRRQVEENIRMGEGPVVATGLAEFRPGEDRSVEAAFNRADSQMYGEKARLKELKLLRESHTLMDKSNIQIITEERRHYLDMMYKAFDVVADGTYVYLCDMKYDFSRWSKNAVDTFGLPSEYMYGAGDIWENHIHPEDRAAYHKGIDDIFAGNAAGHDMQYRARRVTGEYDVCTCRGVVIRDPNGEPDYFAGTIRNHGVQGHIDTLTGLKNQYGFFEDLDSYIYRHTGVSVILFGVSHFSEINEMYGYHFGNRVLQLYARSVLENTGNRGHVYRIDGTKFAILSNTLSLEELHRGYTRFRAFLNEGFQVGDRRVLLDLHCGALRVSNFEIDSQTVYACLNFAREESKLRRQGEMVVFHNNLNKDNRQRLEKLHAIRSSIMHGYKGFYLLYQPVVDAETERLISAEALLRWKDTRYGIVPPNQFIPILESDPLFPELGKWIIRESVLAAREMLKLYPDFIININLSYTQLEKPDFVDMVFRILNELNYPPEHLCFELTERCRLLDLELLKNVLASLKAGGILVALDDFGTGFSSVGILKEIPVNIIKIDRSFVRQIEENDIDRQVVRNIADLASIFSAKVCIEGIETKGMRDIMKRFQVESFQGYYYAKPLPLERILKWSSELMAEDAPGET